MILGLKVIFPLLVPFFTMPGPATALSRCTTLKTSVSMISPAARSLKGFWGGAIVFLSFLYTQFFSLLHTTREQTRGYKNSEAASSSNHISHYTYGKSMGPFSPQETTKT